MCTRRMWGEPDGLVCVAAEVGDHDHEYRGTGGGVDAEAPGDPDD